MLHARVSPSKQVTPCPGPGQNGHGRLVVIGCEPPRRETEGTFLQEGSYFLSKEPVPRLLPANPTAALEGKALGSGTCGARAAAFWKGCGH